MTADLTDKILHYIEINRVSSTEVADALKKSGELDPKLSPLMPKKRAVGRVYYAPSFNGSNWHTHYHLQAAPLDHIIYVEGINCAEKAIFGALVAKYAILYKQARALIVSGKVRDGHTLLKEEYPIWSWGLGIIGCANTDNGLDEEYYRKRKQELEGAIIVADDSGVVLIKKDQLTAGFLKSLEEIELQEDIWFDCIDRLKYSTFETVCLKKYKNEQ